MKLRRESREGGRSIEEEGEKAAVGGENKVRELCSASCGTEDL